MTEDNSHQRHKGKAARWTARLALAGVSVIAAIASYFHALTVVQAAGGTPPVSYLVPFLADFVILGASAALLSTAPARPPLAMVSLGTGIGVTVAMNVAAGAAHGVGGALVAGWPALAFILSLETLLSLVRRDKTSGGEVHAAGKLANPEVAVASAARRTRRVAAGNDPGGSLPARSPRRRAPVPDDVRELVTAEYVASGMRMTEREVARLVARAIGKPESSGRRTAHQIVTTARNGHGDV